VDLAPRDAISVPASAAPRVSVIVPTTRQSALLADCLRALAAGTEGGPPCETIVVLNGATPETVDLVRSRVRGAQVVESRVNLGVAGGGNLGREVARGALLAFLHDDTVCEPGWLRALVEVADTRPDAGAVGGRVLHPEGRLQSAGAVIFRDGSSWPLHDPSTPERGTTAVDYCPSCSLLVRAETWDAVGGLDERLFPAYHVDADLGLAVWSLGQTVLCALESRVRHRRGSSSSPLFRSFLGQRNRAKLREKWGAALAEHEPCPDGLEAAAPRAHARVQAAAERARRARRPSGAPSASPAPAARTSSSVDPAERERAALQRASEVHTAYIAELEARLAASEQRERHAHEAAARAARALHEAEHTLQRIYSGGWWRLRARLLPALRVARRLRRRP
jgi:GT2 family glycosyltransferase